jgi:hypothetical protein
MHELDGDAPFAIYVRSEGELQRTFMLNGILLKVPSLVRALRSALYWLSNAFAASVRLSNAGNPTIESAGLAIATSPPLYLTMTGARRNHAS